jgi:hypothetical protein
MRISGIELDFINFISREFCELEQRSAFKFIYPSVTDWKVSAGPRETPMGKFLCGVACYEVLARWSDDWRELLGDFCGIRRVMLRAMSNLSA